MHQTLRLDLWEKKICPIYNPVEPSTIPSDGFLSGDIYKQIVTHEYVMAIIIYSPFHICNTMIKIKE